jgi:hypothetical protein
VSAQLSSDLVAPTITPASALKQSLAALGIETRRRRSASMLAAGVPTLATTQPTKVFTKGSGVSAVTVASGGTGYAVGEVITITGGTAAIPAKIYVVSVSAGAITSAAIACAGAYTANPSNPVAQGSTTLTGTGATFTLTFNASVMSGVVDTVPQSVSGSALRFTGYGLSLAAGGFYRSLVRSDHMVMFEWGTDSATPDIRLIGNNMSFAVMVAAQGTDKWSYLDSASLSTDSSGAPYLLNYVWPDNTPRSYRLVGINVALVGLRVGAQDQVWVEPPSRPFMLVIGDSYAVSVGSTNVMRTAAFGLGMALGYDVLAAGISGSGWRTAAPDDPLTRISNYASFLTRVPDVICLDLGYNDNGTTDLIGEANAVRAAVAAVRAAWPKAKIIAKGPATPTGPTTGLTNIRSVLINVFADLGVPMVDVAGYINASNKTRYTGGDNTHPTTIGHEYLAVRAAEDAQPLLFA